MNRNICFALLSLCFILAGCAKSGNDGKNSLIDLISEAPGESCPVGGYKVVTGLDANGNNRLDANEIQATKYICNGKAGSNTIAALVPEAIGGSCASGGYRLNTGIDENDNGILDDSEVGNSQLICNGATGSNSLVSMISEPKGSNCPNGGYKLVSGIDQNSNNTLEQSEILITKYVCNGGNGANALTALVPEPAGEECPNGGFRFAAGLDVNNNGKLDVSEVTTTQVICNPAPAGNSVASLEVERPGTNCTNGGYKLSIGTDSNKNGILDPTEPQNAIYVCTLEINPNYLIAVKAEPIGRNCSTGGYSFNTGFDSNRNGILDTNEISETTYICNN
jgi:hypothetical protein